MIAMNGNPLSFSSERERFDVACVLLAATEHIIPLYHRALPLAPVSALLDGLFFFSFLLPAVEVPGVVPSPAVEVPFEITPETLEYAPKRYGRQRRLRPFRVTGRLDDATVSTSRPLTGEVVVEESERPIKVLLLLCVFCVVYGKRYPR